MYGEPPHLLKLGFMRSIALFVFMQIQKTLLDILSPNHFKQIQAKLLHCTRDGTDPHVKHSRRLQLVFTRSATNCDMYVTVFWDVMLHRPVEHSQCCRGTWHHHLHGNRVSQSWKTVIRIWGEEGLKENGEKKKGQSDLEEWGGVCESKRNRVG
jgi:hypothetical protein